MTPNLNLYGMLSDLGRGLGGIAEDERKRRMQAAIGDPLSRGDYAGAAKAATTFGEYDTGISLLKLDEATKLRKQQAEADAKALDFGGTQQPVQGSVTPGPISAPQNLMPLFQQVSQKYGISPEYLTRTAQIESSFDPSAHAGSSSARGLFQFTKGTAEKYGLTNPNDPAAATDAAARLAVDNRKVLSGVLGREPTSSELYLAHQQGATAAAQMLRNPNVPAVAIVSPEAIKNNGGSVNMTAGQFANMWLKKYAGDGGRVQVADASGKIYGGVSGDVTAAPAMADTSGLQARADDLRRRIAMAGTDKVRENLKLALDGVEKQIDRADKLSARSERQQEFELRRADLQQRYDQQRADAQQRLAERQTQEKMKPPTEGQAKAIGFLERMLGAEETLRSPVSETMAQNRTDIALGAVPFGLGKGWQDADYQTYRRSADDFLTSKLRDESGATIGTPEFVRDEKTFLPMPGDNPKTIEAKKDARKRIIYAEIAKLPPHLQEDAKARADKLYGVSAASGLSSLPANEVSGARRALAAGVPREVVIEQLRAKAAKLGVSEFDASGL